MRTSGGKAAPSSRWPSVPFRLITAFAVLMPLPASAAEGFSLDAGTLLTLGINLGVILFAIGTALGFLRATRRAETAERAAALEADRYRRAEGTLETVLSAEPQLLVIFGDDGEAELLVANLPPQLGVPSEIEHLLDFSVWLDEASVTSLDSALQAMSERGEAFNLMLRTQNDRYIEIDGRAAGGKIALKVRDLAGQRLELASLADKHKALETQVTALRLLLEAQPARERGRAEPDPNIGGQFRGFDRLATAFAVFDRGQRLTHFNQAYVDLWQLDPEWLATHPRDSEILDRLRHARRLEERADYRDWKRGWLSVYGTHTQVEDHWHLPDGRMLHVIADADETRGVTYLYENITERIALESRYNALIEVQRETLDTLREGVAVFGQNGRLRLYNRAFADLWHLNPSQLDSKPHIEDVIGCCRVLYNNAEEWERTKAQVTAIVAERVPYETQYDRDNGSVIASAALPLPDGGTLLTYIDVSDSKRVERVLRERNEALERTDRLRANILSNVSYELRTPLTTILGFAELLEGKHFGPLTQAQEEYLSGIMTSGWSLLSITDAAFDLATMDAGYFELELTTVDIRDLVNRAAASVRPQIDRSQLKLEMDIDSCLGTFVADGARVVQILRNLLSNAIGFSSAGGTITLTCQPEGEMVALAVADQGVGIPDDYQAAVFERFESRSQGSRHRGPGLGLALVKSIAELHGGSVSLKSIPGRGTTVRVLLPLRRSADAKAPEEDDRDVRASRAG